MALHLNINGTANGRALNLNGTAGGQEISSVKENKINRIINISGQADLDVNAKTEYTKPKEEPPKKPEPPKEEPKNPEPPKEEPKKPETPQDKPKEEPKKPEDEKTPVPEQASGLMAEPPPERSKITAVNAMHAVKMDYEATSGFKLSAGGGLDSIDNKNASIGATYHKEIYRGDVSSLVAQGGLFAGVTDGDKGTVREIMASVGIGAKRQIDENSHLLASISHGQRLFKSGDQEAIDITAKQLTKAEIGWGIDKLNDKNGAFEIKGGLHHMISGDGRKATQGTLGVSYAQDVGKDYRGQVALDVAAGGGAATSAVLTASIREKDSEPFKEGVFPEQLSQFKAEPETKITLSAKSLFQHNSANLSEAGKQELNALANKLNDHNLIAGGESIAQVLSKQNQQINIVGHTDATGSSEYNLNLSAKRAENVNQYLVSRGVPENILSHSGAGEKFAQYNDASISQMQQSQKSKAEIHQAIEADRNVVIAIPGVYKLASETSLNLSRQTENFGKALHPSAESNASSLTFNAPKLETSQLGNGLSQFQSQLSSQIEPAQEAFKPPQITM